MIFIPKNSRKLIKMLGRNSSEEWIIYSKLVDIESLNTKFISRLEDDFVLLLLFDTPQKHRQPLNPIFQCFLVHDFIKRFCFLFFFFFCELYSSALKIVNIESTGNQLSKRKSLPVGDVPLPEEVNNDSENLVKTRNRSENTLLECARARVV